jgi:hypothetical protein
VREVAAARVSEAQARQLGRARAAWRQWPGLAVVRAHGVRRRKRRARKMNGCAGEAHESDKELAPEKENKEKKCDVDPANQG